MNEKYELIRGKCPYCKKIQNIPHRRNREYTDRCSGCRKLFGVRSTDDEILVAEISWKTGIISPTPEERQEIEIKKAFKEMILKSIPGYTFHINNRGYDMQTEKDYGFFAMGYLKGLESKK